MIRTALGALTLLAAAAPAGAGSAPPGLAVSAWPARLTVTAPGVALVAVGNPSDAAVRVAAQAQAYALDARGRPRIGGATSGWLTVRPLRFVVPPRGTVRLRLGVRTPPGAGPGDHPALVLLSTEPSPGRRVVARLRLGVVVTVRVRGRLVRRLGLGPLRNRSSPARTRLELAVVNRGNVDEWIGRGRVTVVLVRAGWRLGSMTIDGRRLLARSSGVLLASFRSRVRGPVQAIVVLHHPRPGVARVRRVYRLRL